MQTTEHNQLLFLIQSLSSAMLAVAGSLNHKGVSKITRMATCIMCNMMIMVMTSNKLTRGQRYVCPTYYTIIDFLAHHTCLKLRYLPRPLHVMGERHFYQFCPTFSRKYKQILERLKSIRKQMNEPMNTIHNTHWAFCGPVQEIIIIFTTPFIHYRLTCV